MNELTNETFLSYALDDLYLPMFGVQDTRTASGQELLDAINTACVVAQTSRGTFNSVISELFSDHVCKSIVSENPNDYSLYKAFAPVVQYMRFLQDILPQKTFPTSKINIDKGQSFFRRFDNITQPDVARILESNIAELVPLFFFKAHLQNELPRQRATMWLNRYQQKPLSLDYEKGVENMARSIDPGCTHEELTFIANDNIDILAYDLLAIGSNQVKNIKATALYKAYQLFIDRIFQEPTFTNVFSTAPQWLKNDVNFMRRAIGQNSTSLLDGSVEIQHSRELVTQALQQNPRLILQLPPAYRHDHNYVLTAMHGDGKLLEFMEDKFRQDFDVVLAAVTSDWRALQYAHEDLTKNKEVVLEAIRRHGRPGFHYASTSLTSNAAFMLEAARILPAVLGRISGELTNNRDFLFKAARIFPPALGCASNGLKNDKDFLFKAARMFPLILERTSGEFTNNRDFMLEAAGIDPSVLLQVSGKLTSDMDFLFEAAHIYPFVLLKASKELKSNKDFMLEAGCIFPHILKYISGELPNNRDFLLTAAGIFPGVLKYISVELTNNKDFLLTTAGTFPKVLHEASDELKNDKDFMNAARLIDPSFQ